MTSYLPRTHALATLLTVLGAAFLGSACSHQTDMSGATPAAGPIAPGASASEEDVLVSQARLIRVVDELCDKKIAHANVAATTAKSEEIRDFANELKREYAELRAALKNQSFRLGFTVIKLEHAKDFEENVMATIEQLLATRGNGFDRAFLDMTISDHESVLMSVEKELAFGNLRPELREMVEMEIRPTLRKNAEKAEDLLGVAE